MALLNEPSVGVGVLDVRLLSALEAVFELSQNFFLVEGECHGLSFGLKCDLALQCTLAGVHHAGKSDALVVAGDGLLDQGLIVEAEQDGCEGMLEVMLVNASCVLQCGVGFVGID